MLTSSRQSLRAYSSTAKPRQTGLSSLWIRRRLTARRLEPRLCLPSAAGAPRHASSSRHAIAPTVLRRKPLPNGRTLTVGDLVREAQATGRRPNGSAADAGRHCHELIPRRARGHCMSASGAGSRQAFTSNAPVRRSVLAISLGATPKPSPTAPPGCHVASGSPGRWARSGRRTTDRRPRPRGLAPPHQRGYLPTRGSSLQIGLALERPSVNSMAPALGTTTTGHRAVPRSLFE
jgi:hypothetical protein